MIATFSRTPEHFHLADATPAAAASYVKNRLGSKYSSISEYQLNALGGRLHDLDLFVSKIQAGLDPKGTFL